MTHITKHVATTIRGGRVSPEDLETIRKFNKLWHESGTGTWHTVKWLGVKVIKSPMDLWIYQELICKVQPGLIIETGTCYGGSALYMAHILNSVGKGKILTIDIKPAARRSHGRLKFFTGDSVGHRIKRELPRWMNSVKGEPVMVILDSDHHKPHVLAELDLYAPLVTVGSYLIVEDTSLNGDVRTGFGPGPAEALAEWLPKHPEFVVDKECEKYYQTFHPGGYLKRIK